MLLGRLTFAAVKDHLQMRTRGFIFCTSGLLQRRIFHSGELMASFVALLVHCNEPVRRTTSMDFNFYTFFVCTLNLVFMVSLERSLSLESIHI